MKVSVSIIHCSEAPAEEVTIKTNTTPKPLRGIELLPAQYEKIIYCNTHSY